MATSSILGGERAADSPAGKDVDALGPSDSSDSGSDVQASPPFGIAESQGPLPDAEGRSDSDAAGTGERGAMGAGDEAAAGADIAPDRIVDGPDGGQPARGEAVGEDVDRVVDSLASETTLPDDPRPAQPEEEPVRGR